MKISPRLQYGLFAIALLSLGFIFSWRIGNLLPLYLNGATRESVKNGLITVADREGWLLSDMLVTEVTTDHVRLIHREHLRGPDPEACYTLVLSDDSLHPCGEKKS